MQRGSTPLHAADPHFSSRWRQVKSCARCRRLKVKCVFENPTFESCSRCFSSNLVCSPDYDPTAQYARKLRKKSQDNHNAAGDSESVLESDAISTLERLLRQTKSTMFKLSDNKPGDSRLSTLADEFKNIASSLESLISATATEQEVPSLLERQPSRYPVIGFEQNLAVELIYNHQLISQYEARSRFEFFLSDILPYFPVVVLTEQESDFGYCLQESPLIFLAALLATGLNDNGLSEGQTPEERRSKNRELFNLLQYYIDNFVAYTLQVKAERFDHHLIKALLILSQWGMLPKRPDQVKSQVLLFNALTVSRCINVGGYVHERYGNSLMEETKERDALRIFLSIYCSCGALGLALTKYKLIPWSSEYYKAIDYLQMPNKAKTLPKRSDGFLYYFAKTIFLVQEMLDLLSSTMSVPVENGKDDDAVFRKMWERNALSNSAVQTILDAYEKRIYQTFLDSGFMADGPQSNTPKEKYLFAMLYYQILLRTYDNLISGYLFGTTTEQEPSHSGSLLDQTNSLIYLQHIAKMSTICENVLQSFIKLNEEQTINYPAYFLYRPLHALVILVRLQLLFKSDFLTTRFQNVKDLSISIDDYFEKISLIITESQSKYDSINCRNLSPVLQRISKWIRLANAYKCTPNNTRDDKGENNADVEFIKLTDMSRGREIQHLEPPKMESDDTEENLKKKRKLENTGSPSVSLEHKYSSDNPFPRSAVSDILNPNDETHIAPKSPEEKHQASSEKSPLYLSRLLDDPSDAGGDLNAYSIQELYQEIETDIFSHLNSTSSFLNATNTHDEMQFPSSTQFAADASGPLNNPDIRFFPG